MLDQVGEVRDTRKTGLGVEPRGSECPSGCRTLAGGMSARLAASCQPALCVAFSGPETEGEDSERQSLALAGRRGCNVARFCSLNSLSIFDD